MNKELKYSNLKMELIKLLKKYLKDPNDKDVPKKLNKLWIYYFNYLPFIRKEYKAALDLAEDINTNIKPPQKKIKAVIENLRKRNV